MSAPEKPHSPSCDRNREPILAVLRDYLGDRQRVLEIGSGTGQHAVYFAERLPHLQWQASDVEANLDGIQLWLNDAQLANTPAPMALNVRGDWPARRFDAVFTANTWHIMGWDEVEALFAGLPAVLDESAVLLAYGPFNYGGRFTSDSNANFNDWLQARGAHMAIRDFEAVDALANTAGLRLVDDREMPANNRCLVWQRTATDRA